MFKPDIVYLGMYLTFFYFTSSHYDIAICILIVGRSQFSYFTYKTWHASKVVIIHLNWQQKFKKEAFLCIYTNNLHFKILAYGKISK